MLVERITLSPAHFRGRPVTAIRLGNQPGAGERILAGAGS